MVVYIEYVFLENFCIDSALLYLSFVASRRKIRLRRLFFTGGLGGAYAVVFPLLSLSKIQSVLLHFCVGALLCLCAGKGGIKGKDGGRVLLSVLIFYILSFSLAGALTFLGVRGYRLGIAILLLFCLGWLMIEKLWKKRAKNRFLYDCRIQNKGKTVNLLGFYDSGNFVEYKGLPVCMISPYIPLDIFEGGGQVCDEMTIYTMNGESKISIYLGEVQIKVGKGWKKVQTYFSPNVHILQREYEILLSSRVFERTE